MRPGSSSRRPARRRILAAAALLAIAALVLLAVRFSRPARVPACRVSRQDLVQTLVVSGRVMPPIRVNLGSTIAGRAVRRLAEEGDRVRAGQVLLELDAAEAAAAARQARASLLQAAARLALLEDVSARVASESLTQARVTLDRAELELRRTQSLVDSGIGTVTQLDDAKQAADLARSQHQSASAQYASTRPTGADLRAARAAVEQARASLAGAEARLSQTTIRSSADGVIIGRRVEAGDIVQAGQTLYVLAAHGETLLTLDPDEKNLGAIWLGQEALASADAFPRASFPAKVSFIAAAVDPQRGTVEVRLTVPVPPPFLRPDMTVSVELHAGRKDKALVVPAAAVRDVASRPWVLAVKDGRTEHRPVTIGLRGDALIEITAGVREGEILIPASAGSPPVGAAVTPDVTGR